MCKMLNCDYICNTNLKFFKENRVYPNAYMFTSVNTFLAANIMLKTKAG